jgi:hypothetical protein
MGSPSTPDVIAVDERSRMRVDDAESLSQHLDTIVIPIINPTSKEMQRCLTDLGFSERCGDLSEFCRRQFHT